MSARQATGAFSDAVQKLRVGIPRRPKKLKTRQGFGDFRRNESRMFTLRQTVTDLVREERIELASHKAFETRPYAERLLQLAITKGMQDMYANEMINWWLGEEADLIQKLFKVLVPRYENAYLDGHLLKFTNFYRIPYEYKGNDAVENQSELLWYRQTYIPKQMAVLELKGNPFPPVLQISQDHSNSLVNVLLKSARNKPQKRAPPTEGTPNDQS